MARVESLLQKTFLFDLVLQSGAGLSIEDVDSDTKADSSAEVALKQTMDILLGSATDGQNDLDEDDEVEAEEHQDEASDEDELVEAIDEKPDDPSDNKRRKTARS